jgi:prepilin-type processing-associated H-X9-DG protein
MKCSKLRELVLSALVLGFVAFTLAPVLARLQRESAEAKCQSNLHRLGEAIALYVADNAGRFPTNRPYTGGNRKTGTIKPYVALSAPELDPATGKPRVFDYGITWVEALYPYVWKSAETTGQDWHSFWKCPNATSSSDPTDPYYNCAVSYVFNGCLAEYWAGIARSQNKLMMIREFGRLTCSSLRPTNQTSGDANMIPMYPFLCNNDYGPNMTKTSSVCKPHANGSHVLFADGHVQHFTLDYFPDFTSRYCASTAWDKASQQWWNYTIGACKPGRTLTIAVTP